MSALNCWEVKKCGREPNGSKVSELGVCPASEEKKVNGYNHGKNGGRVCWLVTGTFCGGKVQGSYAVKLGNCMKCDFYKSVRLDEGKDLAKSTEILKILNS